MRSTKGLLRALLFGGVALLAACGGKPDTTAHEQRLVALGTIVTVSASQTSAQQFAAAIADLEPYLQQVGSDWYPWAPGELAAVNAALRADQAISVSPPLQHLLQRAATIESLSGGTFNAGLGELSELWGFNEADQDNWQPPDAERVAEVLAGRPTLAALRWSGSRVSAPGHRMMLDLGGIAKGAILRQATDILQRHGVDNAIVDIGGDLMVIGQVGSRAARIGIRSPVTSDAIAWVAVESGEAVMTSGDYERFFEHDGRRYAHVLDPRNGYPAEGTASATVIDEDPVLADAAATALLVGGAATFSALCADLGIEFALLVSASGDLSLTDGMQRRVNWQDRTRDRH